MAKLTRIEICLNRVYFIPGEVFEDKSVFYFIAMLIVPENNIFAYIKIQKFIIKDIQLEKEGYVNYDHL
jgi:hypothetical protein